MDGDFMRMIAELEFTVKLPAFNRKKNLFLKEKRFPIKEPLLPSW